VTAWRDAFAAAHQMPVVLGVAMLAVLALNVLSTPIIPREVGAPSGLGVETISFVVGLVQGFLLTPVAIAVHRFVLFGEREASYRLEPANPRFRRLFFFTMVIQILIAIPAAVVGLMPMQRGSSAGFILLAVFFLFTAIVMLRTLILFPAIAADAPGADLNNAWRDSKGHSWRILFIVIAVPIVVVYAPMFYWLLRPSGPSLGGTAVMVVVESAETVIATAAYAAVASRLFMALADRLAGPRIAPSDPAAL
jgi:cytochrome bd-type quinol oxidase subunit 2